MTHAGDRGTQCDQGSGARPVRRYTAADVPPIPDLSGLQKRSYEAFLQPETPPEQRQAQGLENALRRAVTLDAKKRTVGTAYAGYRLAPDADGPAACRRYGRTYGARLALRWRAADGTVTEEPIGDIPLMTARGTFILKGQEKVVAGCLRAEEGAGPLTDLRTRRLLLVGDQLTEALAEALAVAANASPSGGAAAVEAVTGRIASFFFQGTAVRPADDINPLSLISQVRRVVHTIPGKQPGYDARCVHPTHFGRLCLLETPEGERIGTNLSLALLADVNAAGHLLTPYRRPDVIAETTLLAPEDDEKHIIGDLAGPGYRQRYGGGVLARVGDDVQRVATAVPDLFPVHPGQALGASASLIPFVAHDDPNRALMGTNMQKQAVPLNQPQAPIVATGLEAQVARDAGSLLLAACDGTVSEVTPERIVVTATGGRSVTHDLTDAALEPVGAAHRWRPLVQSGESICCGQPIAGGPATDQGVLALGRNVLLGYMPWEGYNFEDGIVISDKLTREGHFDSVKVQEFTAVFRAADAERPHREHLPAALAADLDPDGVIRVGAAVQGGAVLVASAETGDDGIRRDLSVRLPLGQRGTVTRVEHYRAANGHNLAPGTAGFVRVTVESRRPLQIGDKLCNRHGAKGVVSLIVPEAQMPMLPDGRHLEVLLDPLGVPSRMNLGSILEAHLGLAAHALGRTIVTSGFNGAALADIEAMLQEAGLPKSGMFRLVDGRTGRPFDQETTVGYVYMMKLDHLVADKHQARSTGPYAADTQQPVGGRRFGGGQRLGLMETWALQGHGAAHTLHELLTLAADDVAARAGVGTALVAGRDLPAPTVPHSVRRLVQQLRGLCLDLTFAAADGSPLDVFAPGAAMQHAATATVQMASPERIIQWSAGEVAVGPDGRLPAEVLRPADGLTLRYLRLACPVQHCWREFSTDGEPGPLPLTVLPILPLALCPGTPVDALYTEIGAASSACRGAGDRGAAVARLQRAVDDLQKALTRCLYGKHGWITAALSGKTVDYSGRSVVCPGPDLAYDTCSLPETMAAVLLEPLVIGALTARGLAPSAAEAGAMLSRREPAAMSALRQVADERCVILHRAPVLHRLGMQAFRVRVAPEDVIRVHPLTLVAFNADFDGDEMDVFVPLGAAAQAEAWERARASRCQLSPAHGGYVAGLTQDMVIGCFYATCNEPAPGGSVEGFPTLAAVAAAHAAGRLGLQATIAVEGRRTTVGRALLNQLVPPALGWFEGPATKGALQQLLARAWHDLGPAAAATFADALMRFGFHQATLSGLSLGKDLFRQFSGYDGQLAAAWARAREIAGDEAGPLADETRRALLAHWLQVTDQMSAAALAELAADRGGMNPLHLMLASGARGSRTQVRQHIAMRGPVALSHSRVFSAPIATTFIRGHSPLEYLAAAFGARRGLADTALKTAESGYLFKCIMNAVQDVTLVAADCGCNDGVAKSAVGDGSTPWLSIAERIAGRTALRDVRTNAGTALAAAGAVISADQAHAIQAAGIREVWVRSPVTCRADGGVCAACYGVDLATWEPPRRHLAVGVLAAQSIGEPATQLTMRTFHPGAVPSQNGQRADIVGGLPRLRQLFEAGAGVPAATAELREVADLCRRGDRAAATEVLLLALQRVYREQGVRIDDRHFEVVLAPMLRDGLRGVSTVAAQSADFVVAGSAPGGVPALAAAAFRRQCITLKSVRHATLFGRCIPAPAAE